MSVWASYDDWLTRDLDDEREDTRRCADCGGRGEVRTVLGMRLCEGCAGCGYDREGDGR